MFLAMTAEEIRTTSPLPDKIALLGPHFSSDPPVLTGLPKNLPPGCGLVLDDRNSIPDADQEVVAAQLSALNPAFLLLDFQRPPTIHSSKLVAALAGMDCPVPMPPAYAEGRNCPVFLPPVPPHVPIHEHVKPWRSREIWLELALDAVRITVTARGSQFSAFPHGWGVENPHKDSMLHCHYKIIRHPTALEFYCYRTREDIDALLSAPLPPNVTHTIGLYQELGDHDWDDK